MLHTATSFNGDLSCWDVGQVRRMVGMFAHATSFDCQLGGAWATSTAGKRRMLLSDSPGTIAGKMNDRGPRRHPNARTPLRSAPCADTQKTWVCTEARFTPGMRPVGYFRLRL